MAASGDSPYSLVLRKRHGALTETALAQVSHHRVLAWTDWPVCSNWFLEEQMASRLDLEEAATRSMEVVRVCSGV